MTVVLSQLAGELLATRCEAIGVASPRDSNSSDAWLEKTAKDAVMRHDLERALEAAARFDVGALDGCLQSVRTFDDARDQPIKRSAAQLGGDR